MSNFLVVDIGGGTIKYSVIDKLGEIKCSNFTKLPNTMQNFKKIFTDIIEENKSYNLKGLAISSPGIVDSSTGFVELSYAIPYISKVNLKEVLIELTGLKVEIENDANCVALGESWLGSAKDYKDIAFVVCGTGIGGAIIKNKVIHKGNNLCAGEFGLCIVGYNKYEELIFPNWSAVGSTRILADKVAKRKRIDKDKMDGVKVFDLYEKGDMIALEEVDKYYTYMAIGIYNIYYTYNPEVIILGGAISERPDYISQINKRLELIMKENNSQGYKPNIKVCQFGNNANKFGALYNFLQKNSL